MSSIAPRRTLGWKLLPAVLAIAASVSVAGLALEHVTRGPLAEPVAPDQLAVPDLSHAPWQTDLFPVGAAGPLTAPQRKRFEGVRESLRPVVRNIADAVVFSQGELKPWVARLLAPDAMKALGRARLHMPEGVSEIEALSRRARIGIQAPAFEAAAARIRIEAQGTSGRRVISWRDTLTLWFERGDHRSWRVIAFDLSRERER